MKGVLGKSNLNSCVGLFLTCQPKSGAQDGSTLYKYVKVFIAEGIEYHVYTLMFGLLEVCYPHTLL